LPEPAEVSLQIRAAALYDPRMTWAMNRAISAPNLGVDHLVLLPQPDARCRHWHYPIPADRTLVNIDAVAAQLMAA
jgi:hypothetical protein